MQRCIEPIGLLLDKQLSHFNQTCVVLTAFVTFSGDSFAEDEVALEQRVRRSQAHRRLHRVLSEREMLSHTLRPDSVKNAAPVSRIFVTNATLC